MTLHSAAPDVSVVRDDAGSSLVWGEAQLSAPVERPAVRVTTCTSVAVVLGRGQRATEADRARARAAGIELLVRASGGGAVLAGPWMLDVSVALPAGDPRAALPLGASYAWLGKALAGWLNAAGVAAESTSAVPASDERAAWACFARMLGWEPHVGGRKIVGLAQVRRRQGVLYTAGVLLDATPWALLCAVLGRPDADAHLLAERTASCSDFVGQAVDANAAADWLGQALAAPPGAPLASG